jgi:hypothetical protein
MCAVAPTIFSDALTLLVRSMFDANTIMVKDTHQEAQIWMTYTLNP